MNSGERLGENVQNMCRRKENGRTLIVRVWFDKREVFEWKKSTN